jgi:hypothetical protein
MIKKITDALIKAEGPTRHAHAHATSADSIPLRSLYHCDFIDKTVRCSIRSL